MHREKFGERLKTMFAPETEAALKAMESGLSFLLLPQLFARQSVCLMKESMLVGGVPSTRGIASE